MCSTLYSGYIQLSRVVVLLFIAVIQLSTEVSLLSIVDGNTLSDQQPQRLEAIGDLFGSSI